METYVVRIVDEVAGGGDVVRGVVRRIADGTETTFHDGDQLVTLLRTATSGWDVAARFGEGSEPEDRRHH